MFDVIETRTMRLRDNYCPYHPAGKVELGLDPQSFQCSAPLPLHAVYSQDVVKAVFWGNLFWKCHTEGIRKEGAETGGCCKTGCKCHR